MFDHIQKPPETTGPNRTVLLAATAGTLGAVGLIVYGCLWVLSMLGFTNKIPPVEVTYDPYEDGTDLEDLLGEGEVPLQLEDTGR